MLGPLDSTPYRELAKLYAEAGFFESALVEKDRALALDPSNLAALNLKIFLLSWMGKQAEADLALWTLQQWQPEGPLGADRELRTMRQRITSLPRRSSTQAIPLICRPANSLGPCVPS